jgi:hypothetical protein
LPALVLAVSVDTIAAPARRRAVLLAVQVAVDDVAGNGRTAAILEHLDIPADAVVLHLELVDVFIELDVAVHVDAGIDAPPPCLIWTLLPTDERPATLTWRARPGKGECGEQAAWRNHPVIGTAWAQSPQYRHSVDALCNCRVSDSGRIVTKRNCLSRQTMGDRPSFLLPAKCGFARPVPVFQASSDAVSHRAGINRV